MNSPQYTVKLENVVEDIKIFRTLQPELRKKLDKEIKSLLRPILVEAQNYLPANDEVHPSGWRKGGIKRFSGIGPLNIDQTRSSFVAYDVNLARAGLKTITPKVKKDVRGYVGYYGITQRDVSGSIYETAGRGSRASRSRTRASASRNPNASRDFIRAIEKYHGVLPTARHEGKDKGRALIRAFDNNRGKVFLEVRMALRETIAKLQNQINNNAKEV
jgi:hypothetical protein